VKVIEALKLADGGHRFVIEAVAASPGAEAIVETFNWGADVALADARRETRLLLAAKYDRTAPVPIAGMVGREL